MKYSIWLIAVLLLCATPLLAAPVANKSDMPDAMQHMVKAPYIDFANLRDPFASYLARVTPRVRSALRENRIHLSNHKREKLEDYDLAALRLVATFSMGGERVAMVEDSVNKGYIVRRGNYLGKHNGKVEKIDTNTVYLVEQALNPAGDSIDRQVTLTMKEVNE